MDGDLAKRRLAKIFAPCLSKNSRRGFCSKEKTWGGSGCRVGMAWRRGEGDGQEWGPPRLLNEPSLPADTTLAGTIERTFACCFAGCSNTRVACLQPVGMHCVRLLVRVHVGVACASCARVHVRVRVRSILSPTSRCRPCFFLPAAARVLSWRGVIAGARAAGFLVCNSGAHVVCAARIAGVLELWKEAERHDGLFVHFCAR